MIKDDDINTCYRVGTAGVAVLSLLIWGLCIAILIWA